MPIQLWRPRRGRPSPANPWYEEQVRLGLPRPPDYHVVVGAGHYDFLPACGPHVAAIGDATLWIVISVCYNNFGCDVAVGAAR